MKIAIVGGNSRVATELAFVLREWGVEVVPVVRNSLGTHFLAWHGFDCRVADVSDPDEARSALSDADAVVVAAFAWQYSHEGFQSRGARRTNEALVRNAVRESPPGPVVYFSSQAAYGDDLEAPAFGDWDLYTREKRNAERLLRSEAEAAGVPWYALRLGFVHGPNQTFATELAADLTGRDRVRVAVDPGKPSNVVHTVTVADAVRVCAATAPEAGVYAVTNEPQWTWGEVVEHYADAGVDIEYRPPGEGGGFLGSLVQRGWRLLESREKTLRSATVALPDSVNERLFDQYLKHQRGGELAALDRAALVEDDAFAFGSMPGPPLPDLRPTRSLLASEPDLTAVFTP